MQQLAYSGQHVLRLVLRNSISHCATFESAKDLLQNLRVMMSTHSASCDDVEMVSENQSEHETQDANTC